MWEPVAAIVTLVSGVIVYWFKSLRELKLKYDAELREARLSRYRAMWAALEPLAKYGRDKDATLSRSDAADLTVKLRRWYFETGGLYLSVDARNAYFALMNALNVVGNNRWGSEGENGQLDEPTFEALRVRGSNLRSAMSRDVGTREPFMLRSKWAPIEVRKVQGTYESGQSERSLELSFSRWRRLWGVRAAGEPTIRLGGDRQASHWDPRLWVVTATVDDAVRVLTLEEDGKIVEAPPDAELDADDPSPAILWRRTR
jgi:hypothetical protein